MSGDLLELASSVASSARAGEQIEAYVVRAQDTSVRVYEGEIEQLASARSEGIGVRVIVEGRQGFAYAGALTTDAIADALADARDNVTFGTPDEFNALAVPDGVAMATLELWNDDMATTATERKVALALELDKVASGRDRRVRVESADYGDGMVEGAVATSTGVRCAAREAGCYITVSTLATDGDETQTGFGFSVGRTLDELDVERAAADGALRATRLLGAVKPASARVTVILDPFVTAEFLSVLSSTVNGEAVLKGRSLFAGRVGESVAASCFTLVDDPTNPLAFGATQIDGEGLATRRNVLIDAGVLAGFVHNAYSGRRSGGASTGSAVRGFKSPPGVGCMALALTPGTRAQAELIASVDEGVLVQEVSGMHSGVNPVSGDFSTGASGLRISGGQLGAPIKEFTIASTLQKMLLDVVEVGSDVEWLPMSAAGVSLVMRDVSLSGI
jgi:PmbA protein